MVIGAEVQFEDDQGGAVAQDDTAMNGLRFIFAEPNDGISTEMPLGEWIMIGSSNQGILQSMTYSMEWKDETSVTNENTRAVTEHVEAGFEMEGLGGKTEFDYETSKTVANQMSDTFARKVTFTEEVTCGYKETPEVIYYLFQWKMRSENNAYGPGFTAASPYYLCYASNEPPKCPPGYCENSGCQTCIENGE